jgi:quercetin dioxygenase-like cupin family protein
MPEQWGVSSGEKPNPFFSGDAEPGSMVPAVNESTSGDLKRKVLRGKDLVAYQEGSVVSRMLSYKKSGTVTLFAFDSGEGLSEHTAPYDALLQVLEGEAGVSIENEEFSLREGDMIIMPAGIPHAVHAEHRFKMMLTMIHE